MHDYKEINHAIDYIRKQTKLVPTIGIVLGMESNTTLDFLEQKTVIPTSNIPFFPSYFLSNQHKELIIGEYAGKIIAILRGRYKYYSGYTLDHITFPIRVLQFLGVKNIILTRVGGAINPLFNPGEFMAVNDHINFTGLNPLIGPYDERLGPRILDLTDLYNNTLNDLAKMVAYNQDITLNEGVLAWFTGPSFETPAEIRVLKQLNIDGVASALVPEAIIAHHGGMNVLSIILFTNKAAGLSKELIEKTTIIQVAKNQKDELFTLLRGIIELL